MSGYRSGSSWLGFHPRQCPINVLARLLACTFTQKIILFRALPALVKGGIFKSHIPVMYLRKQAGFIPPQFPKSVLEGYLRKNKTLCLLLFLSPHSLTEIRDGALLSVKLRYL